MTTATTPQQNAQPVYALGQLTIRDRARYQRYVQRFLGVLRQYGGELLVADEAPVVVEGAWDRDKVVLMRFANAEAFWAWARSDEYQTISRDRTAATEGCALLLHGMR